MGSSILSSCGTPQSPTIFFSAPFYFVTVVHIHLSRWNFKDVCQPPDAAIYAGGASGYVMTQVDTWGMTGSLDAFRKGAAAYRNGRDWTKKKRDEAIERANKLARGEVDDLGLSFASGVSANTEPTSQDTITHRESNKSPSLYDSDTSADLTDVVPISKDHRAFGDASSASRASRSEPREEAAPAGSPLKRLITNLDIGDD
jgi:hypothetical protein